MARDDTQIHHEDRLQLVKHKPREPTGLMTRIYALRSNPSRNEQLWRRTSSVKAGINTFELVGMPPNDGGADRAEVHYAVAASTKLKCHMNEVLNVLVSQKTSDYEATMQALSGKRFEGGEVLYRERCRLMYV
ncbi:hypothetical protein L914_00474 [Phytophthora nicotianae]|uniref:Uncharacterized protein n=1 Tax=Phytophthora nicotianae TaxID=4792 RepID=W2P9B0_PHYNI|nr:hypothetical protein L914_00474 [Phytophthora nicotianae]